MGVGTESDCRWAWGIFLDWSTGSEIGLWWCLPNAVNTLKIIEYVPLTWVNFMVCEELYLNKAGKNVWNRGCLNRNHIHGWYLGFVVQHRVWNFPTCGKVDGVGGASEGEEQEEMGISWILLLRQGGGLWSWCEYSGTIFVVMTTPVRFLKVRYLSLLGFESSPSESSQLFCWVDNNNTL